MNITIALPDSDSPGFLELQRDLAVFRQRVANMNANKDPEFWEAVAEFAERFIVDPTDSTERKTAAMQLSRKQLDQITKYLQGDAEAEQPKPPLPTSPL